MSLKILWALWGLLWQAIPFPGPGMPASSGGGVTITEVQMQHLLNTGASGGSVNITTTAGNLLVVIVASYSLGSAITSATATGDGTLTHCPTNWPQGFNYLTTNWTSTDCWYQLSSAGGARTITYTPTYGGGGSSQQVDIWVVEYNKSSGTWAYDVGNVNTNNACTTCATPAVTITGNPDVCAEFAASNRTFNATPIDNASYNHPVETDNAVSGAIAADVALTSYSAPNWNMSSATNTGNAQGVACWK